MSKRTPSIEGRVEVAQAPWGVRSCIPTRLTEGETQGHRSKMYTQSPRPGVVLPWLLGVPTPLRARCAHDRADHEAGSRAGGSTRWQSNLVLFNCRAAEEVALGFMRSNIWPQSPAMTSWCRSAAFVHASSLFASLISVNQLFPSDPASASYP